MMIHLGPPNPARHVQRLNHRGRRHLHLANPNRTDQPLRQLILRLCLHHKPHIDRHRRHAPQREVQNRVRDRAASDIDVNFEVIRTFVVSAIQRFP